MLQRHLGPSIQAVDPEMAADVAAGPQPSWTPLIPPVIQCHQNQGKEGNRSTAGGRNHLQIMGVRDVKVSSEYKIYWLTMLENSNIA
jgi:hypothetical protein